MKTFIAAFMVASLSLMPRTACLAGGPANASPGIALTMESIKTLPSAEVERRLPSEPPAAYYGYAGRLWAEGDRDRAVFWLYAGELRFRFLLLTEPKADPSGDPALFASLYEVIGAPINLYAGSDTAKWISQINAALKWDADTPNGFTSKTTFKGQWLETRRGLESLRDYIGSHGDELRRKREQEGIGKIGIENGVYVEERRPQMPPEWPALEQSSTPSSIVGVYKASFDLGNALFSEDRMMVLRATTFEIASDSPESLVVVARRGDTELHRRSVTARSESGAVVFDETVPPDHMGLSTGSAMITVRLRTNTANELIIERELQGQGQRPNSTVPTRFVFGFWTRAQRTAPSP